MKAHYWWGIPTALALTFFAIATTPARSADAPAQPRVVTKPSPVTVVQTAQQNPWMSPAVALAGPAATLFATTSSTLHWTTKKLVWHKVCHWGHCKWKPKVEKVHHSRTESGHNGQLTVGCIMGSALGLIGASVAKGEAHGWQMGFIPPWEFEAYEKARKADKAADLTTDEATFIAGTCGLGAIPVAAQYSQPVAAQPVVITAKN